MAEGKPPRKSDRMKTLEVCRSCRSREWYVWPCNMISAPNPRVQSRNVSRETVADFFIGDCIIRAGLLLWKHPLDVLRHSQLQVRIRQLGIHLYISISNKLVISCGQVEFLLDRIHIRLRNPQLQFF